MHPLVLAPVTPHQEIWSHRQLVNMRPSLDIHSAARDHILAHCRGKSESMPLVLIGVCGSSS
jgi:hypothetical protein